MLKKVKASEPRVKRTRKGFERESEGHNSRIERETDMTQFKGTEREKEKGTGRSSRVQREKGRKGQEAFQGYGERMGERNRMPFKGTVSKREKGIKGVDVPRWSFFSVYIIGLKWGPKEINPVGLRNFHSC